MKTAFEILTQTHSGLKSFPDGTHDTRAEYEEDLILEAMELFLREGLIEFCNFYKIPFSSNITELENGLVGFKIFTTEQGVDNFLSSR